MKEILLPRGTIQNRSVIGTTGAVTGPLTGGLLGRRPRYLTFQIPQKTYQRADQENFLKCLLLEQLKQPVRDGYIANRLKGAVPGRLQALKLGSPYLDESAVVVAECFSRVDRLKLGP